MMKVQFEKIDIPSGREVCEKQFFAFIEKLKQADISHGDYENYLPYLKEQFDEMSKEDIIKRMASLEFNRFLKYYEKAGDLNAGDSRNSDHGKYSRLFISLGEKDGFYKAAFLEFLLDTTGHTKAQLGKIELMDAYSFVEVEKDIVQEFMTAFEGKKFRGRQIKIEVSADRTGGGRNSRGGWGGGGGGGGRDRDRGRGNGGGGGGERRFENRGRSGGGNSGGGGGYKRKSY